MMIEMVGTTLMMMHDDDDDAYGNGDNNVDDDPVGSTFHRDAVEEFICVIFNNKLMCKSIT